jgi:predicted DsbA family dithiol-disulfide isomerase
MRATLWSDYLCPWCYLGQDRTELLEQLGVEVTHLPFELHPEVPIGGTPVRPGGRLAGVLARIAEECAEVGLPFVVPARMPNTRRALEAAEIVRQRWPERFAAFDRSLFAAVFVDGDDLGDPAAVDRRAGDAGVAVDELRGQLDDGAGARAVAVSLARAREVGVTATPAWLLDSGLLIPGVQARSTITRWIERIHENRATATERRPGMDGPPPTAATGGT